MRAGANLRHRSAGVLFWIVFAAQLVTYAVQNLNRARHDPTLAELSTFLRAHSTEWLHVDLPDAETTQGAKADRRVPLPDEWLEDSHPPGPGSILLFVDNQPAHYFYGDPEVFAGAPYGYYKGPRSRALILRCPRPCRSVDVVLDDARLRWRLSWRRVHSAGPWLATILVGILGAGALAFCLTITRPKSILWMACLVTAAFLISLGFELYTSTAAPWILGSELLLLVIGGFKSSVLLHRTRRFWDETKLAHPNRAAVIALGIIVMVVALPYVLTGISWTPGETDDSFLYINGASRLLTTGSLIRGALNPNAWVYSGYSFVLALIARVLNTHPMIAYRYFGFAGAFLLPASVAAFAYASTRRVWAAALACVVAGLWGGCGGYSWLFSDAVPSILHGKTPTLLAEDYYESRFLGEYTGPHSELIAYLCRVPFYPRELGLVLFWPGLGLLYGGLPSPSGRRLAGFTALGLLAAAVYPYYGFPLLIVWAFLAAFEVHNLASSGPTRRSVLIAAFPVLLALILFVLSDFFIRRHDGPPRSVNYLLYLHRNPVNAPPPYPSLRFRPLHIMSDHVFMLAAIALTWLFQRGLGRPTRRPPLCRSRAQWLFWLSLGLSILAGTLSVVSRVGKVYLHPYGWIVPWRSLVEPLIVTRVGLSLESALARLARYSHAFYAIPILCLPMLSPLYWTVSAEFYHRRVRERYIWQSGRTPYDQYAEDGRHLLGRTTVCEPLLAQGPNLSHLQAALGLSLVMPERAEALLSGSESALLEQRRRGEFGDLAVHRQSPIAKLWLQNPSLQVIGVLGGHVILRPTKFPCRHVGLN